MGLLDSVVGQAKKVQLQGEIALTDRDIAARKRKFGVDLYTLLTGMDKEKSSGGGGIIGGVGTVVKLPSFFLSNEASIREPFEACRTEIRMLQDSKEAKELELHHIGSARDRSKPAITNQEYVAKAKSRVADAANETKLKYDIVMLERQIKQRQEKFGMDVYDLCVTSFVSSNGGGGMSILSPTTTSTPITTSTSSSMKFSGSANPFSKVLDTAKTGVAKAVSSITNTDTEIKNCVLIAKRDIDSLMNIRSSKQRQMESINKK